MTLMTLENKANSAKKDYSNLVTAAWEMGKKIDLQGITYGLKHWGDRQLETSTFPYYHFLAGIAALFKCQTVIEIGTHFGASSVAMARGMLVGGVENPEILTYDIGPQSTLWLPQQPESKFIDFTQMDANCIPALEKAISKMRGRTVDMMYIDGEHSLLATLTSVVTYQTLFRPKIIVLDDVVLNDSMTAMWDLLMRSPGFVYAENVSLRIPEIRPQTEGITSGFGIIFCE